MKIELKSIVIGLVQEGDLTMFTGCLIVEGKIAAFTKGNLPGDVFDLVPLSNEGRELITAAEKFLSNTQAKSNTADEKDNDGYKSLQMEIERIAQKYLDERFIAMRNIRQKHRSVNHNDPKITKGL